MNYEDEPHFPEWMGRFPRQMCSWRDAEDEALRRAWIAGKTVPELMARHGRGQAGIVLRLKRIFTSNYITANKPLYRKVQALEQKLQRIQLAK